MVFTKDIARFAALTAITLGLSTQAQAVLAGGCDVNVACGPGEILVTTSKVTDTFGPQLAPWASVALQVPKFDPAAEALLLGVAEGDITLKAVRLTLRTTVHSAHVQYLNENTSLGCNFDWTYNVAAGIQANGTVGTNMIQVQVPMGANANLPVGLSSYDWDLATDGGGEQTKTACHVETVDLAQWIGSGEMVLFNSQSAASDNDTSQCGGLTKSYTNSASQAVSVEYFFCYQQEIIETGCLCERPSPHYRRPGSLLLFPEFDNRMGDVSVLTVTNTDCTGAAGGQNVDVEFIYIDEDGCAEYNKTETLTPCDTLTLLTNFHNPNHEQGYVYAFAKNQDGDPIVWNHLIGSLLVISGFEAFDYGLNPVVFQGMGDQGTLTDIDMDGNRDLDGAEYEPAPDTILIPRFLGQDPPPAKGQVAGFRSQLILIALTGGRQFDTQVCFLFWNDNEVEFSAQHTFSCWEKPYLDDINAGFRNTFLKSTDHDLDEIIGADHRESGWICLQGCLATSGQESIMDPSIYAVLVERVGSFGVADLPFECGIRLNGALLPDHIFGDGDPIPVNGDNQ
jgi:hypothetical protein